MLISEPKKSGILIPIPQYPLYTATLAQYNGVPLPYLLDESSGWSTAPSAVEAAIQKAHAEGIEIPQSICNTLQEGSNQVCATSLCCRSREISVPLASAALASA